MGNKAEDPGGPSLQVWVRCTLSVPSLGNWTLLPPSVSHMVGGQKVGIELEIVTTLETLISFCLGGIRILNTKPFNLFSSAYTPLVSFLFKCFLPHTLIECFWQMQNVRQLMN
jgi:hypothetical protein